MSIRFATLFFLSMPFCLSACTGTDNQQSPTGELPTIEVTATYDADSGRHLFLTNADTVQSGWTTFRFINASPVLHFVFLDHLPGDRTSDDLMREVSPIFQESMDLITQGKPEEAGAPFARLPEWFNGIVFRGGPGFTSPGLTNETTLFLEPGNYVLECYIKTADGVFHWNLGMHADLHVTDETHSLQPQIEPTVQVTVTDSTLVVDGELSPGKHHVAVVFEAQEPDTGILGKDVHVARMEPDTDLDEVLAWMDVARADGLVSTPDAQAPAIFLSGTHEMPPGNTAYFTLELQPGQYLWVSEQPAAQPLYELLSVE